MTFTIFWCCLSTLSTFTRPPQVPTSPNPHSIPTRETAMPSTLPQSDRTPKATVEAFFAAFGGGDLDALVATFATDATITAVRAAPRTPSAGGVYGTYLGREGARAFVAALGETFDTKAFSVDHIVGDADSVAFASGSFTHHLRSNDRPFASDWALMCVVVDGEIAEYHFYEDSATYERAVAGDE